MPGYLRKADAAIAQRVSQAERLVGDAEERGDGRPAQIGIDEQYAFVAATGERSGQIDGGYGLSVACRGAGDGDHLHFTRACQTLNREAQALVLLGRERGRVCEAHEPLVTGSQRIWFSHVQDAVTHGIGPQKAIIRAS